MGSVPARSTPSVNNLNTFSGDCFPHSNPAVRKNLMFNFPVVGSAGMLYGQVCLFAQTKTPYHTGWCLRPSSSEAKTHYLEGSDAKWADTWRQKNPDCALPVRHNSAPPNSALPKASGRNHTGLNGVSWCLARQGLLDGLHGSGVTASGTVFET